MNEIVAANPDRRIHVAPDNLNAHKPKHDRWLKSRANVRFHFTRRTRRGSIRWNAGSASQPPGAPRSEYRVAPAISVRTLNGRTDRISPPPRRPPDTAL